MASSPSSTARQKLVASIQQPKTAWDMGNLMCFHEDNLLIWNGNDQCLNVCSFENEVISNVHVITLTNPPVFTVNTLSLSPHADSLALYGTNGLMVVELPRNWTQLSNSSSNESNSETSFTAKSTSIGERMFLCSSMLKLLCLRWHPISRKHLLILTNDDYLRLFDIEDEYEPVETISLARRHPSEQHFNRVSAYTHSLGEGAVAFDFGPSLGRFHALDVLVEALDILPVFVLRGNGDVLLFFLSLKDLSISNYIFGPLKMTPAAEDNYGTDACSILCLNCVPPVVVIGTSTGLLYHCIAIEGDSDEELLQQSDDDQSTVYRPEEDAVYAFSTASGLQVAIPESILYVLESIELSFPLTSAENADESLYNVNALNSSLVLLADGRDPKRYLCQHSFGVHIVLVSFLKQLHSAAASLAIREFHDEKSVVEYLVCTRPTIEKGAVLANKNAASSSSSFPVGVTLYAFRGFTHIAVLLNSAELICKRLNNVVLPEAVEGGSGLPVKSTTSDISSLLASPGRHSAGNTAATGKANSNFPQHLEKILQRNSSLPLIKSSAKTKSAAVGQQELEMLITAIDLLRKEYLEKFSLAAKAIEQRKKALRNICQKQFKDIETLKSEKEQILADYIKLMKKYEQTKDAQSLLSARLDKKIAELQYQRPTLSDAEITLKEEMTAEVENIAAYKAKYEQIKRKQRYQEAQLRKVNDGTAAAAMFNGGDADDAAGGRAESAALMPQLNTIKEQLTCQGEEISQLVSLLNRIKCVS